MKKNPQTIITLVLLTLLVAGLGYLIYAVAVPLLSKVTEYVEKNNQTIATAEFFIWDRDGKIPLNYINGSNYNFIITKVEKLTDVKINKHIVLDYTNGVNITELKNDPISKTYGVIGIMIKASYLNDNLSEIKSLCNANYCNIRYLTQFFIYDDTALSEKASTLVKKYPQTFSIFSENYIQDNKTTYNGYENKIFSIEQVACDDPNCIKKTETEAFMGNTMKQAQDRNVIYQFEFSDRTDMYHLSQLPRIVPSVIYEATPIIKWDIIAPHNGVNQNGYSLILSDRTRTFEEYTSNYPVDIYIEKGNSPEKSEHTYEYLTGRYTSPFTQAELIPETEVIGSSHKLLVNVWVDISFGGFKKAEGFLLYPETIDVDFDFLSYTQNAAVANFERIAWIPSWGFTPALTVLNANPTAYTTLSPVWFEPNETDGSLNILANYNHSTLFYLQSTYGVKIVPTIALVEDRSADILSNILNNHLDAHVDAIVNEVVTSGYDGIDIDYESTYLADANLLMEFVQKLGTKLHENGKILSFTVLPKWGDSINYGYAPQTHQAQDWQKIGEFADQVRVMVYDYRGSSSFYPGPTVPYTWYLACLRYGISKVPREKLIMGIPLYGYTWGLDDNFSEITNQTLNGADIYKELWSLAPYGMEKVDPVVISAYSTVPTQAYAQSNKYAYYNHYDTWNREHVNIFVESYLWWYSSYLSEEDVNVRINAAESAGAGGFAVWRLVEY
ncbi:hypothetical protein JW962_01340 [Candidatus Dojkabacteria bacterium]|nr:hypothetical protein [Candidatus Dojkabacteria bacterium]